METLSQLLAKMSVFSMAQNLTKGHPTEKDYIEPYTVMAEEHPPSPMREDESFSLGRLRGKPAMTISRSVLSFGLMSILKFEI